MTGDMVPLPMGPAPSPAEEVPETLELVAPLTIPYAYARKFGTVVQSADPLTVALREGADPRALIELRRHIGRPFAIARVEAPAFDRLLSDAYAMDGQATAIAAVGMGDELDMLADGIPTAEDLLDTADDAPAIRLINGIIADAARNGVSDIHIEPYETGLVVRMRIDGVLRETLRMPPHVAPVVVSRIKVMARLDIAERRVPQDGRMALTLGGKLLDVRVSTLPSRAGERVVLRILDKENAGIDLDALGMNPAMYALLREALSEPNGIILVTGPTGSGKTTTLYSTLKQLATPEVNVCTIEDPIEMVEAAFNQMQVQLAVDLGFAEGVRALMRQDPDIIMVGEIRDLETGEMAIQAALTGHLVLSTLHTNDAPSAITRMLDLGVPSYLLSATTLGIMAQRLVRILCPHCKQAHPATPEDIGLWDKLVAPWKANRPAHFHHPVGCLECRMTGYLGRVGLYEILLLSPDMKQTITDGAELAKIRELAYREGMKPLRISGAMKVAAGLTTLEEVLKVAPPVEQRA